MTQSHSLLEGRQIRVAGGRARVVDEGQVLLDVSVRPVGEEQVQQSLVAAIEAALLHGKVQQLGIGVHVGRVHEHARVEAVWPADVGRRGQLLTLKQLIGVLQHLLFVNCKGLDAIFCQVRYRSAAFTHQGVSVQEHTLFELNESPAVQLGECDAQFGTGEQGQIGAIL